MLRKPDIIPLNEQTPKMVCLLRKAMTHFADSARWPDMFAKQDGERTAQINDWFLSEHGCSSELAGRLSKHMNAQIRIIAQRSEHKSAEIVRQLTFLTPAPGLM